MKKLDVFEIIKNYWPDSIDISDMEIVDGEGDRSRNLIECHERVRNSIDLNGSLLEAAIWPFYVAIGKAARQRFLSGLSTVGPEHADVQVFNEYLKIQLEEGWEDAKRILSD
jgi:hypothetical protein